MSVQTHWFYVLYSLKDNNLYKGTCSHVETRFLVHTSGGVKSTKHRRPLILLFTRKFDSKSEALAYERYVKTIEGGIHLKNVLINMGLLTSLGKLSSDG